MGVLTNKLEVIKSAEKSMERKGIFDSGATVLKAGKVKTTYDPSLIRTTTNNDYVHLRNLYKNVIKGA